MNHNLHEWYLDVEIVPQDGQLEKRLLGIKKCVETLEKEKNSDNVIAWIVALVELYYGIPSSEETKNAFADFFSAEDSSFSVRYVQELSLLAGATLAALVEDSVYFELAELLQIAELEKMNADGNTDATDQIAGIIRFLKVLQTFYSDLRKQIQQFDSAISIYKEESQLLWWLL